MEHGLQISHHSKDTLLIKAKNGSWSVCSLRRIQTKPRTIPGFSSDAAQARVFGTLQIMGEIALLITQVPEIFFCHEEKREREKERSGKRKPLVVDNVNLTIMLR